MEKVGNIPSSALAMPPVHGLITTMVDDQRDLRDRLGILATNCSPVCGCTGALGVQRHYEVGDGDCLEPQGGGGRGLLVQ